MGNTLKLPVGIENFEEIRKNRFYYIDKTRFIEQLVTAGGQSDAVHAPTPFRENVEYEHAALLFRDWCGCVII